MLAEVHCEKALRNLSSGPIDNRKICIIGED